MAASLVAPLHTGSVAWLPLAGGPVILEAPPRRCVMRIIVLTLSALLACGAAFAQETETTPAPRAEPPLPEKITLPETPGEGPTVTIRRQENGDSVQEYRENGRLTMVKVTTPAGITYSLLDTNG